MRNPFKPRKAPAQTWTSRPSVLSADDPVFKGLDETERKSLEATPPIQQQLKPLKNIPSEPPRPAGGDGSLALGTGPSSQDSISIDSGHGYAAIAGSFAGADHSGH